MVRLCVGLGGLAVVMLSALCGGLVGLVLGGVTDLFPPWPRTDPPPRAYPLPHHVPKYPGGVSLRFAMVHDVLHERYPRHGSAYYQERNRRARRELARHEQARPAEKRSDAYFALLDDLGAGLDHLGKHEDAVQVLRDKLRKQEAQGLSGWKLYTTYANLGTFLMHGSLRLAIEGNVDARGRLKEGLRFIKRAREVNPSAHFGREVWQVVLGVFLLAAREKPTLLSEFDLVGNQLHDQVDLSAADALGRSGWVEGGSFRQAVDYLENSEGDPKRLRESIRRVGAEEGWKEAVPSSHKEPVPFDEPTLGIIGMWRLGGGPNPHFALALGEIMLRVGQGYIAWCAYERAVLLAARFASNKELQSDFIANCRGRQERIEEQLPANEVRLLRPRFQAELAYGQRFQKEYQEYEAQRIKTGASLDAPDFYAAFFKDREPIATPLGRADSYLIGPAFWRPSFNWGAAVFVAGLFAFFTACLLRWRAERGSRMV
jgi:hypothetical protein